MTIDEKSAINAPMVIEILMKNLRGSIFINKSVAGSNNHKSLSKKIKWKMTNALSKSMAMMIISTDASNKKPVIISRLHRAKKYAILYFSSAISINKNKSSQKAMFLTLNPTTNKS
jgi:hypothetical protein